MKKIVTVLGFSLVLLTVTANATPPLSPNFKVAPDLDFNKFNEKRDCSPAERLAGKTNCMKCDPDTPHVVKPYSNQMTNEIRQFGGEFVYGNESYQNLTSNKILSNGYMGKYNGAYDFKPFTGKVTVTNNTTPNPPTTCGTTINGIGSNRDNCQTEPTFVLYKGYNLQGVHPRFAPINNRTVCELIKPKTDPSKTPKGTSGLNNTAIAGIAGMTLTFGGAFGSQGKGSNQDWKKLPIFNDKGSFGQQNGGSTMSNSAATNPVSNAPFYVSEMFACLEYYTGGNPSMCGGDHIQNHKTQGQACKTRMQTYYNTKISEIWCGYYPCDGDASDNTFKPGTIALRQMLLMTNPFIAVGQTLPQSLRIATQRPMTCNF